MNSIPPMSSSQPITQMNALFAELPELIKTRRSTANPPPEQWPKLYNCLYCLREWYETHGCPRDHVMPLAEMFRPFMEEICGIRNLNIRTLCYVFVDPSMTIFPFDSREIPVLEIQIMQTIVAEISPQL